MTNFLCEEDSIYVKYLALYKGLFAIRRTKSSHFVHHLFSYAYFFCTFPSLECWVV